MTSTTVPPTRLGATGSAIPMHLPPHHAALAPTTTPSETLIFGLGLATALLPTALLGSVRASQQAPPVRSVPVIDAAELQRMLGRRVVEAGQGQLALRRIDQCLAGLLLRLDLFRAREEEAEPASSTHDMLVSVGTIGPERGFGWTERSLAGPTLTDVWPLVQAALTRYGGVVPVAIGGTADALLGCYGQEAAQAIWLANEAIALASVTSLHADEPSMQAAVQAVAALFDARLRGA